MFLSIIIPAYNEEKRITKSLIEIDQYLRAQKYDYEIIVVNDGSQDKTAEIVEKLNDPGHPLGNTPIKNLYLIDNKKNMGKGFVVRQGFLRAMGEYRLFTDADNSVSINQVENFMPYFNDGYSIVIGSRSVKGAILNPAQPRCRRFLGNVFSIMVKAINGLRGIKDTQCGFKIFNSKSADALCPKCKINRWAFDVEILILAQKLGYKIKEVPVIWKNNIYSRVDFKSMFGSIIDLIKIRFNSI
jgi:dolichyl-phosphate beta-glucosyltransferase